jgi:hypothetical protein
MMLLAQALLVVTLPFVVLVGVFALVGRWERRRAARVRLQILVTDAIHRELGAVAAPEVERRRPGGWRVRMQVPAGRPALVGPLVQTTTRALEGDHVERFEIVLLAPATAGTARGSRLRTPLAVLAR